MPAGFLAGASLEPMELARAPVDERGCRRDIRSSGWTAALRSLRLPRAGSVEETGFLRSLRILLTTEGRSFTGTASGSKFAPDVFADALVPSEPGQSCRHLFIPSTSMAMIPAAPSSARFAFAMSLRDRTRRSAARQGAALAGLKLPTFCNGYRRTKPEGKPSLTRPHKALKNRHFLCPGA